MLIKCMFSLLVKELCILFGLSPSELVEEWIAHVTRVGYDQEPTLLAIGEFERKVLCCYQPGSVFDWGCKQQPTFYFTLDHPIKFSGVVLLFMI